MRLTTKLCLMLTLLLLASTLIFLKGCGKGDTKALYGSKITINPATVKYTEGDGALDTVQPFTVTVTDSLNLPLNGVQVTISGGFAFPFYPTLYTFFDNNNVRQPSGFNGKTDEYGNYHFSIVIPPTIVTQLADPVINSLTGTTLAALPLLSQYCYQVSATNTAGETDTAPESCVTLVGAQSAVNLSWGAVTGATGYNIYGNRTGIETRITSVGSTTLTFNDDGTPAPGATLPPVLNTTTLPDPVNAAFTAGAGILPAGTYYYRVSATNAYGETLASAETSFAAAAGTGVNVNWGAVTGATGYNIYGRTTGGELFMAAVGAVTTWLDDGSIMPFGALPLSNTTTLPPPAITATGVVAVRLTPGSTYCYQVSAFDSSTPALETAASAVSCVTLTAAQNAVDVTWAPVYGIGLTGGYNIYGRSSGAEFYMTTVGAVTTWTDNGSITPSTLPPPGSNGTAKASKNSFTDKIGVTSGAAFGSSDITYN